jgi:hypothetical protein
MNELYKQAKSLSDAQLNALVSKLSALQNKRKVRAEEKQKAQLEAKTKATKAIEEIERFVKSSGLSLEQLGMTSPLQIQAAPVALTSRKKRELDPHKQNYALSDQGAVEVVSGRRISMYRERGALLRFEQLSTTQQAKAVALVERING